MSARDWAGRLHLPTLAVLVVVLVGWTLLSRRYGAYVLPAPGSIVTGFAEIVRSGEIWTHAVASLSRIAVGFGLRYQASGLPAAALFLLFFIPFVWGIGMISAAMQLTFRKGAGLFIAFITLFTVGSGAYVPVSLLPGPAAAFAPYNPVGVAAQGMRASLLPSRVKRADFAFFTTRDYRAKSMAFKP